MGLKALQALAESKGIKLSVGDIKAEDLTPTVGSDEQGPQPLDVASRLVAHIGHRVPGVRKIEKRLEGRDKTSGILSDVGALVAQLYARNEDAINQIVGGAIAEKAGLGKSVLIPVEDSSIDFGPVGPESSTPQNNNGGGI